MIFDSFVHCLPNILHTWPHDSLYVMLWPWRYFKVIRLFHIKFLKNVCDTAKVTKSTPRRLRSTDSSCYSTPRLRTKFGERALSISGPSAWNALPTDIRDEACTTTFKKKLKTFYFCTGVWLLSKMHSAVRVLLTLVMHPRSFVVGAL